MDEPVEDGAEDDIVMHNLSLGHPPFADRWSAAQDEPRCAAAQATLLTSLSHTFFCRS